MTGIIKKLLAPISDDDDYMIGQWPGEPPRKYDVLRMEAANEIERLRAALRQAIQELEEHGDPLATDIVKRICAALEEK